MKFESITIKNFRNFEDVKLDLSNKNIFFGLNDVCLLYTSPSPRDCS